MTIERVCKEKYYEKIYFKTKTVDCSLLLIHGMANTSDLFDPLLQYLKDYYVIVVELDGHSAKEKGTFISVSDAAEKIERYVKENIEGRLFGLLGFSLGGTIATELISRRKIEVDRTVLDAAFVIQKLASI